MTLQIFFKLLILHCLVYYTNAVSCQLSLDTVPEGQPQRLSRCDGDFCVRQVFKFFGGNKIIQYGCLTGFNIKPGCTTVNKLDDGIVCYCNHTNMCNKEETDNKTVNFVKEIDCNNGTIKDGKLLGNGTCRGETCTLSVSSVVNDKIVQGVAGCSSDRLPILFSDGCALAVDPGKNSISQTWACLCRTNLCNKPSTTITKSNRTVKCVLEDRVYNGTLNETAIVKNETCIGEYCMISRLPIGFTKTCMTTSNGTKLSSKTFSLNIVQKTDFTLCNHDWCNRDIVTQNQLFPAHIKHNEFNNGQLGHWTIPKMVFHSKPGCKNLHSLNDSFICYCNHTDMCNGDEIDKKRTNLLEEIECNDGKIVDGRLQENRTCRGETCTLTVSQLTMNGTIVEGVAGCSEEFFTIYNNGCYLPNPTHETWECSCRTNFCNKPSTIITIPDRETIMRIREDYNSTLNRTVVVKNETCFGEYCMISTIPIGLVKTCFTTSNGTKLSKKAFSMNMVEKIDIIICKHDLCNHDVNTAKKNV